MGGAADYLRDCFVLQHALDYPEFPVDKPGTCRSLCGWWRSTADLPRLDRNCLRCSPVGNHCTGVGVSAQLVVEERDGLSQA